MVAFGLSRVICRLHPSTLSPFAMSSVTVSWKVAL
jgi:hypothetical protein